MHTCVTMKSRTSFHSNKVDLSCVLPRLLSHPVPSFFLFFSFLFFFFLGPQVWHMEVPRLEIKSELHLLAYTTDRVMEDLSSSATYTTAHRNTGFLTYWVRPGIESTSSWILVKFVTAEPQWELLTSLLKQIP